MAANPQAAQEPVHATYVEGDMVLYDTLYDNKQRRPVKLANRATGPYRVIGQTKNDVSCRHICTGIVYTFQVDRLTLFTGNMSQAERLALEDADQEVIEAIDGWRGDPSHRRTMEFLVKFRTNAEYTWEAWSENLSASGPFEHYCLRFAALRQLLTELSDYIRDANLQRITAFSPGDDVYVSLRYYNWSYYDQQVDLPNKFGIDYVVKVRYRKWDRGDQTRVETVVPVFGEACYGATPWFVEVWGSRKILLPSMREITTEWFLQYPSCMEFVPLHTRNLAKTRMGATRARLRQDRVQRK